jgi:hypothetical protein
MSLPQIMDWQTLLILLRRRSGLTYERIGRRCTSDWRHIGRLARGETLEPRFSTAIQLLDLAADHLTEADWQQIRHASPLAQAA